MQQELKNTYTQSYDQATYMDDAYVTDIVQSIHPAFSEQKSELLSGFAAEDQGLEKATYFMSSVSSAYSNLAVDQGTTVEAIYHENPSQYIEAMAHAPAEDVQSLGDGSEGKRAFLLTEEDDYDNGYDVEALWSGDEMLIDYGSDNGQVNMPVHTQPQIYTSHHDDFGKGGYIPEGILDVDIIYTAF